MCDVSVPTHLVRIIMNWYSKILAVVKRHNCYAAFCTFFSGVGLRQGGVLSPVLFRPNVYIPIVVAVIL